jgi:AcrR family transcriptional regulator
MDAQPAPELESGSAHGAPAQLPSGRHGLSRRYVLRHQRERIVAAVTQAVAERGYAQTTVGDIVTEARLSRRTFYEHFTDKEDCFLAAYDAAVERVVGVVGQAYRAEERWSDGVRAALESFVALLVAEPELGRLCLVEAVAAGPAAHRRRERVMRRFAAEVRNVGERQVPAGVSVPPLAAELVVGGLHEIVSARFLADRPESLFDELPQMTYCVLVPFCGHREASAVAERAEAERARPEGRAGLARASAGPA